MRIRALTLLASLVLASGCGHHREDGAAGPTRAIGAPVAFVNPSAVAVDGYGNLFVADFGGNLVFKIARDGKTTIAVGTVDSDIRVGLPGLTGTGGPATAAKIAAPDGLAIARDGSIVVAEHANNRIRAVTPDGNLQLIAGAGPAVLNGGTFGGDGGLARKAAFNVPDAIALDQNGNLFVADRENQRVRRIDPSGHITTVAGNGTRGSGGDGGPATSAQLDQPDALAVDREGNLFVGEGNRIRRIDRKGAITTFARVSNPSGLTFDAHGNLYVAEWDLNRIQSITPDGTIVTITTPRVHLNHPRGITFDKPGNLYVADYDNARVIRLAPHGGTTTLLSP